MGFTISFGGRRRKRGISIHIGRIGKRMTLAKNQVRGKIAEEVFVAQEMGHGKEVERTGHGSDYRVRSTNFYTGKLSNTAISGSLTISPSTKQNVQDKRA